MAPVTIPGFAMGRIILRITFHWGVPKAIAASFNSFGTRVKTLSVVLIIIGIAIIIKTIEPAHPEKWPTFATKTV
jgi:hypothetical protein